LLSLLDEGGGRIARLPLEKRRFAADRFDTDEEKGGNSGGKPKKKEKKRKKFNSYRGMRILQR